MNSSDINKTANSSTNGPKYAVCVLAAGSGTRFGGQIPKQLYPIGKNQEILTFYNLENAYLTGFTEAVIVTKSDLIPNLKEALKNSRVSISFATQEIPANRTKPSGTVDAMLQGAKNLNLKENDRLLVINADDLYPKELFSSLYELAQNEPEAELMASFPIAKTMVKGSKNNRGVVHFDPSTLTVTSVEETYGIEYRQNGTLVATGKDGSDNKNVEPSTPVSMTTWMLTGRGIKDAESFFNTWWNLASTDKINDELPHPQWIDSLLKRGVAVKNVPLNGHVRGLTSQDDIEPLREILVAQGY